MKSLPVVSLFAIFMVAILAVGQFALPLEARATGIDTGWISADYFQGTTYVDCAGERFGEVWGQTGKSFTIPGNGSFPAGNYKIDIVARYGYYYGDAEAPQNNEVMRARTATDTKNIGDLNGSGGGFEGRDNCPNYRAGITTYTNILNGTIHYPGSGNLTFEGQDANSQSIKIYKVRVYSDAAPVSCEETSEIVNRTAPTSITLSPGQNYSFSVAMKNTGDTKWYSGTYFQLVQKSNLSLSPSNGPISRIINPNDIDNWNFSLTAPTTPGTYTLEMQMVHRAGADYLLPGAVKCANAPSQNVHYGQTFVMTIVVQGNPPTTDIKANGSDSTILIDYNSAANISWTSQNANSCTVSPSGWTGTSGAQSSGNLTSSRTYTVSCVGAGGTATDSVTVNVKNPPLVPTADIKANGQDGTVTVPYNNPVANITWTSQNANSCTVSPSGWTGTSGAQSSGNLTSSRTYTISCVGAGGTATDSVTVNIGDAPPQQPTADIKANGSDTAITIPYNSAANISWTSQNANSCIVSPSGWTGTSGFRSTNNLTNSQTYTLTCTGAGGTATDSVTVNVENPSLPTVTINANPGTISQGQSSILTWTSQNANSCTASGGWNGAKSLSGSEIATPSFTTTYTITCVNSAGQQASAQTVVNVTTIQNQPTLILNANPTFIQRGQSSVLTWTSQNTTSCFAQNGWSGSKALSGSETVFPFQTTTYTMTCQGAGGTVTQTVTVTVSSPQPTVTLYANPSSINQGQSSVLSWSSQNANSCSASTGWSGSKALSGSETVFPTYTITYTITCVNENGLATDTETVIVNQNNANNLQVTKLALNRTLNQAGFSNNIEAQGSDTLEFEIRVRNNDYTQGSVTVRDILPPELVYVNGSTQINGSIASDGITFGGITLGNLNPGEERVIRFQATVFAGTAQKLIVNQAVGTMGSGTQSGFANIQIRNRSQVLGAADIVTGPENVVPWILLLGFLGSIASYGTMFSKRFNGLSTFAPEYASLKLEEELREIRSKETHADLD